MNEKGKARRAAYQARQEKEGRTVANFVFGGLFLLAVISIIWAIIIIS